MHDGCLQHLQHFKTKLWNITNFVMLFQAMVKFLSRLAEFKILVNWGLVHYFQVWHTVIYNFRALRRVVIFII